jgi:hypothetical protein
MGGLVLGAFFGAFIGAFAICMCVSAGKADEQIRHYMIGDHWKEDGRQNE